MDYKSKYLKYKQKYLELKQKLAQTGGRNMTPEEWAIWYRKENPYEEMKVLIDTLRNAARLGLWHSSYYAEEVIKHLKKMDTCRKN